MSEFSSTRHLFLPCVEFELLIYPNGATAPTPIEKAAMLLIGSFWEAREKLAIDVFIDILSLGEPAGRELINGLWRKGWIVIGGADATLYPSTTIQAHLKKQGAAADFANMGTSEPPQGFSLFYDLILGQTFIAPGSRISSTGTRPYMIEPFYPDSSDAPYGVVLSSFIELTKRELISTLQHDVRFRKWRAPQEAMDFLVVPPAHSLSQKNMKYVRLFFDIGRDIRKDHEDGWYRDFIMRGAERSNETLKRLADRLSDPIVDNVLSQDTPLREKFLDEVQPTRHQKRMQKRRARSRIGIARQKFQAVDSAADRELDSMFAEARELTERAVHEVSESLERSKMRQAVVRFVDGRAKVEALCAEMLERFTDQAVLISQDSTAGKIAQAIQATEAGPARGGRLLIQTGGVFSTSKIKTLKRKVDRARSLGALRNSAVSACADVHMQYVDRFDLFVDASVLIRDGTEILFAAESLLVAGNAPQSAFHVELLNQSTASSRPRQTSGGAAKALLGYTVPTFVSPSPRLDLRASRQAPDREPSRLETHLEVLLQQLGAESSALEREDDAPQFEGRDARNLARMIAAELEQIETLLEVYEREAPLTVEGLQDEDILIEAAGMIARAPADMPIIIGVHPTDHIDTLFKEGLTFALEKERDVKLRLVFMSRPNEAWIQYRDSLLASHADAIEIDSPDTLTHQTLQHRRGFSNFLVCGLGCIVASGGFTQRILLGPRRRDKKQLGMVFRGKGAQSAATDMLRALFGSSDKAPVPPAEIYSSQSHPGEVESFLASHMYYHWLVDLATHEELALGRGRINNVGTAALKPTFVNAPVMYERCLESAASVGNDTYLYAVRKAGQLAGIVNRDNFAEALWEAGRLFEAVHICVDPRPSHPLADPKLRAYVATVYRHDKSSSPVTIDPSWLASEEVLALLTLDLFDPGRRLALEALDAEDFPATALGQLAKAVWAHARDAPEAAIVLAPAGRDRPPHPPQVYCADIGTTLKGFERDRGNRESHCVQILLCKHYGPLADLRHWWQGQQDGPKENVAETVGVVRRALQSEFGDGFEAKLSSRGNRERIASNAVNTYDEMNRQPNQNPIHRALVGPKKQGLVSSVARTLELMITIHLAAKPASDGSDKQGRRAVQKQAHVWLDTSETGPHGTPSAILARILRSEGRLAPEGHVDFGLWRFPRLLESAARGAARDVLGKSLLKEEWPPETDVSVVFEHMLATKRFLAAESILKSWQAMHPIGENEEESTRLLSREDKLQQRTEVAADEFLLNTRRLELEAARAGDTECRKKAADLQDMYGGLSLTPQEVEDGMAEMREIRRILDKRIDEGWQKVVAAFSKQSSLWRECANAVNRLPISRRRSVLLAVGRYPAITPPSLANPSRPNVTRSRLRSLAEDPAASLEKAARVLQIKTDDRRGKAILRAAPFLFEDRRYSTAEEVETFLASLNDLFLPDAETSGPISLDHCSDESLWAEVELPPDGLRAWLDWQVPEHRVVVLLAETAGDVTLEDLGVPEDKLPVIINPFVLPPLLAEPHVLIDFADVVSATAQPDAADAIKASVVAKAGWDIVLPWEGQDEAARDAHLARFLSCEPHDLVQVADSEDAADILRRLLARLRLVPRWAQRRLFADPTDAALTANLCLCYCGAGHVAEAYAAILHARAKRYSVRGTVHVENLLEGRRMNDRLIEQALSMMRRWHRLRRLEPPALHKRAMQSLLCRLWLHEPEGYDRGAIDRLVRKAVLGEGCGDEAGNSRSVAAENLTDWLLAESLLTKVGAGAPERFLPNPAHVLMSIDY